MTRRTVINHRMAMTRTVISIKCGLWKKICIGKIYVVNWCSDANCCNNCCDDCYLFIKNKTKKKKNTHTHTNSGNNIAITNL